MWDWPSWIINCADVDATRVKLRSCVFLCKDPPRHSTNHFHASLADLGRSTNPLEKNPVDPTPETRDKTYNDKPQLDSYISWFISPMSLWFVVYLELVTGAYLNQQTYRGRGPHIVVGWSSNFFGFFRHRRPGPAWFTTCCGISFKESRRWGGSFLHRFWEQCFCEFLQTYLYPMYYPKNMYIYIFYLDMIYVMYICCYEQCIYIIFYI